MGAYRVKKVSGFARFCHHLGFFVILFLRLLNIYKSSDYLIADSRNYSYICSGDPPWWQILAKTYAL